MESKDLEEYLGIIVDLEKNVFLQKQLMLSLHEKLSMLCKPKHIPVPVVPDLSKTPYFLLLPILVGCILASAIVAFVICIPIAFFDSILKGNITDYVFVGLTVIFSLGIFGFGCYTFISDDNEKKKQQAKYENALKSYQKACLDEKARMNQETQEKEVLLEELGQLEMQNKSTAQTLANMYGLNIIHEAYRTFPRVCTLYEYIQTGRCHSLEEVKGYASGGAYNLLRREEDQQIIILKLDQILQSLESIKMNQYMLYYAIQEENQKLDDIMSSINQISEQIKSSGNSRIDPRQLESLQKNSKLIAYNTECIEKELHYINRMNYFAGKYDNAGIFLRRPPV